MSARRHTPLALALALTLTAAVAASAQTATAPPPDRGYVEAFAESAISSVTSQSFGAEAGVSVRPNLQVFGSFGAVRDVTTIDLSAAASTIAGALTQLQPAAVSYSVKEPVTFFVGGVRYRIATASKLKPYVSGGLGVASVRKNVAFQLGGVDATSALAQYVTLGSDIAGDESKLMFTLGAGVVYPVWQQVIVDLHYQFGHISSDAPIAVNRVGLGLGVRF